MRVPRKFGSSEDLLFAVDCCAFSCHKERSSRLCHAFSYKDTNLLMKDELDGLIIVPFLILFY